MDLSKLAAQMAEDNKADTLNANIGSDGTNVAYDKAQGNRGKQMNPTWLPGKPTPGCPDDGESEGDVFGALDDTN